MKSFDVIVIGGGIVGLATAYGLSGHYPGKKIAVVEKEAGLARHQTGHNSGVLHSGIYYKPGSMKAATCRAGREAMIAFCDREGIAYDLCGKVIVAVDEAELGRLEGLRRRGTDNGVSCELVSRAQLRDLEPHAAGIGGILVHDTGIVDYKQVCAKLVNTLRERGCEIMTGVRVHGLIEQPGTVTVRTDGKELEAQVVVNCAGLHSDRVAKLGDNQAPAGAGPGDHPRWQAAGRLRVLRDATSCPRGQRALAGRDRVVEHWRVYCGEGGGAVLGRGQRAEVRGQRSEGGGQKAEGRGSKVVCSYCPVRLY